MKKILIIEDDLDLREALQTKLISEKYLVTTAETSESALRTLVESKPDLILLDVLTHSLHAAVFLDRLRSLPKGQNDSKVIVLTNLNNEQTRSKVEQYGIESYLIKSETSLEKISEIVRDTLKDSE